MKGISLVLRYILIFFLVVIILAFAFLNIATSTILNKNYILTKLEETGYYSGIYQEVEKDFRNYIDQSGLEEEVMDNVITEDKVKEDVNIMISNIYEGRDEKIDVTEIRTNLNNNIEKYIANQQGLKVDNSAVETYIDKICEQYKTTMTHTDYEQKINNVYMKILKYADIVNKALLIAMLVLVIVIFSICHERIFKGFSSIGISILSSGVLFVLTNLFIKMKIKIDTITILNSAFSSSLRSILKDVIGTILNYGFIMLGIGLALIILGNLVDSIKYKEDD